MFKRSLFLWSSLVLSFARAVAAQPAPRTEDDLEVPAAPAPVPSVASQPASPTVPAPPEATNRVETAATREELHELRQELAALRATHARPSAVLTPTAAPPAPVAPARESEGAIGPVNLERRAHARPVPEGLKVGGYVQAQFETNQLSEDQLDQSGSPLNFDGFTLRRARLRLDRGWEYAAATLELDANTVRGMNVGVRRAEAALVLRGDREDGVPLVLLSAGILDLPFGYEVLESARVRPFLERSPGSIALFPTEMDVGVKLSGALGFLRYAVALTNGEPVDGQGFPRDPNAAKDFTGRVGVEVEAAPGFVISGGSSVAVGKGFHAGEAAEKDQILWRDDDEDDQIDSGELVAVPGRAATPSENFERWALGLDLEIALATPLGALFVLAEGFVASNHDRAFLPADPVVSGVDVRHTNITVRAVQRLFQYGLVGFGYSSYDPNSDFLESRSGRLVPRSVSVQTFSPLLGFDIESRARLVLQYDFVRDRLTRDARGVPTDAENDRFGVRLQVEL